jgi:teichuronic acid biosynthesis glycosyltransferase TuaC
MKVLFVASGNSKYFDIAPFIKAQAQSLKQAGIDINIFSITGKGMWGYLKAVRPLRNYLKNNNIDIIHAHYTLSGLTAVLTFAGKPIVLSLMGDDAYGTYVSLGKVLFKSRILRITTLFIQPFVKAIISKSVFINDVVYRKNISRIIPNGVSLDDIKVSNNGYREGLGLTKGKKYILFLGDITDPRKNFKLCEEAFKLINVPGVEICAPYPVIHENTVKYLNSVDVLVLTSFMEGSPNVIKEAMACNCPIVTTIVGDVESVIGNTEGCYLASFDPLDFAEKIKLALQYSEQKGRTNGRDRIIKLGLDSETTAKKIIEVYEKILN